MMAQEHGLALCAPRRSATDELLVERQAGGFGARGDAELGEDVGDMDPSRGFADEQRLGDLAVGPSSGDFDQHAGFGAAFVWSGLQGRRSAWSAGLSGETP